MNWVVLRALNKLYIDGSVEKNPTLSQNETIAFFIKSLQELEESGKQITATPAFYETYHEKYLDAFTTYHSFLEQNELLTPYIRFEEEDIKILMKIKASKDDGSLDDLRDQIIKNDESLRGISLMFFKNEKYLDKKDSLITALKKILDVPHFANEKDQQYIYRLECHNPVAIVLCENLDFLMKPVKPRLYRIELWYAGGKNVDKLTYADHRNLPIYYSCDWDYDGLFIIYLLVKAKLQSIQLLTPNGNPKGIKETEHKSLWQNKDIKAEQLFDKHTRHHQMLTDLIMNDQWIIEESNDLIGMLQLCT